MALIISGYGNPSLNLVWGFHIACCFCQRTYMVQGLVNGVFNETWTRSFEVGMVFSWFSVYINVTPFFSFLFSKCVYLSLFTSNCSLIFHMFLSFYCQWLCVCVRVVLDFTYSYFLCVCVCVCVLRVFCVYECGLKFTGIYFLLIIFLCVYVCIYIYIYVYICVWVCV